LSSEHCNGAPEALGVSMKLPVTRHAPMAQLVSVAVLLNFMVLPSIVLQADRTATAELLQEGALVDAPKAVSRPFASFSIVKTSR
jgi:hypothetical protein